MTLLKVLSTEDIKALVDKAGSVYNLSLQTGVREVSIYRYLNGTAEPTVTTLRKLNSIWEVIGKYSVTSINVFYFHQPIMKTAKFQLVKLLDSSNTVFSNYFPN